MAKTSFHLTACDIESSELHNKRLRKLDYVRQELTPLNETFNYTDRTLKAELKRIRADVKAKTGRALQKNAIPIKEGVAVIDQGTTMEQLKEFCKRCQDEFGIIPLQIYMHKDEGHKGSKTWIPNLHAHIVWRMYGEDGRNVRISNIDCARMQTILAECLGMERGQSSDRKHLSSLQFKVAEEEGRVKKLTQVVDAKVREKEELDKQTGIVAKVAAAFGVGPEAAIRKENEQLRAEKEAAEAAIAKANQIIVQERKKAAEAVNQAKNDLLKANNLNASLKAKLMELQNKLEPHKPMRDVLVGDYITFSEHEEYKDEWVARWRDLIVATARIKKDGSVDITEWHPDQESHSYDHASNLNEAWRRIYNYAWGDFEPEWKELYGQGRGREI